MSIYLLLWVNCYCSIKLFPIRFLQAGIKSDCALFMFIPSLSNLKVLRLRGCANLEKLPNGLRGFLRLEELEIKGCPKLESFPETGVPLMLRRLVVRGCRNLKGLLHNYNSCALQSLRVEMCKSMRCFPNGGELPTTLEALHIYNCGNLEYLPDGIMMHHNSSCSLKYLIIGGCGSLKSFPKGVSLPSTLKQL